MAVPQVEAELDDWELLSDEDLTIPNKPIEESWVSVVPEVPIVEEIEMVRLPRKNWKNVNNCKYEIDALNVVKLLWTVNMTQRWKKKYTKHFPTYHAIGKKWQGIVNNMMKDIQKAVERYQSCGDYPHETWAGQIVTITRKQYRTVTQRYPKHTVQILKSFLEDREQLDSGREKELFGTLT